MMPSICDQAMALLADSSIAKEVLIQVDLMIIYEFITFMSSARIRSLLKRAKLLAPYSKYTVSSTIFTVKEVLLIDGIRHTNN